MPVCLSSPSGAANRDGDGAAYTNRPCTLTSRFLSVNSNRFISSTCNKCRATPSGPVGLVLLCKKWRSGSILCRKLSPRATRLHHSMFGQIHVWLNKTVSGVDCTSGGVGKVVARQGSLTTTNLEDSQPAFNVMLMDMHPRQACHNGAAPSIVSGASANASCCAFMFLTAQVAQIGRVRDCCGPGLDGKLSDGRLVTFCIQYYVVVRRQVPDVFANLTTYLTRRVLCMHVASAHFTITAAFCISAPFPSLQTLRWFPFAPILEQTDSSRLRPPLISSSPPFLCCSRSKPMSICQVASKQ